ncbi:MAG: SET domain-containing protein-lysine N-methyltransferase [Chitinophagales bacterium]
MKIENKQVTSFFEVRHFKESNYKSMFATQDIAADAVLMEFGYKEILPQPTRYSVQTSMNRHIHLDPEYLQYINHSCHPNVFFDLETMPLRTLRPLKKGDEVAFFYPSTEWAMTEAFDCLCGNKHCLKRIQGAAFLEEKLLERHRLSPHIQTKLLERTTILS